MKFDGTKVAFGRHQTFAVRYGWLSKGFQAVKKNPNILRSEEAVEVLGVGKWLNPLAIGCGHFS